MRQIVVESFPDSKGKLIINDKKKFHYLSSVLRLSVGDMLYVRLPDEVLQTMTVCQIDNQKKSIYLQVEGQNLNKENQSQIKALPTQKKNESEVWLFQFVPKPSKVELIVRQAVECGVSVLVPVEGKFCQKGSIDAARKRMHDNDERFNRIITEACEQSGAVSRLKILPSVSLKDAFILWKNYLNENNYEESEVLSVALYEQVSGTKKLHQIVGGKEKVKISALVVGAEGGISPEEINELQDNGFIPIHFDTNILRCETAALYGVAAVQTVLGEKDLWLFKE